MKQIIFSILIIITACQSEPATTELQFSDGRWIDLSHPFDNNTIYWPTSPSFKLDTVSEGITSKGFYYSAFSICMAEHGGTHLDAPVHFAEGRESVDEISLEKLTGEGILIDVSEKALADRDYLVTVSDFKEWEETNGMRIDNKIIFLKTGYARFWPDKEKYMGTSQPGPAAVPLLHFPGLSPEAARWLTENRSIKAIGLDTPSIDYGQSDDFKAHRILFEKDVPAFENLALTGELPAFGFYVVALPLKIAGGSGAPMRIVVFLPEGKDLG